MVSESDKPWPKMNSLIDARLVSLEVGHTEQGLAVVRLFLSRDSQEGDIQEVGFFMMPEHASQMSEEIARVGRLAAQAKLDTD